MSLLRSKLRKIIGSSFVIIGILELLIPRIINWVLGSLFLTVGVAGVILPFLNGTFFLVLGLILISFESKYVEKKLHALTDKNKYAKKWHTYLEQFLRKYFVKKTHD
jgi:membrane protein implicated in regulation of membrane protease activity